MLFYICPPTVILKQAVLNQSLSVDKLRVLEPLIPDAQEIKTLRSYKGDISLLGPTEKFFISIMDIPRLKV